MSHMPSTIDKPPQREMESICLRWVCLFEGTWRMGARPWKEREREGDMSMVVRSTADFMNTVASFARPAHHFILPHQRCLIFEAS